MNHYEEVLYTALARNGSGDAKLRAEIYTKARNALNEWFVDSLAPTNERIAQLFLLEEAIEAVEKHHKIQWQPIKPKVSEKLPVPEPRWEVQDEYVPQIRAANG